MPRPSPPLPNGPIGGGGNAGTEIVRSAIDNLQPACIRDSNIKPIARSEMFAISGKMVVEISLLDYPSTTPPLNYDL
jgi:hypothetical protein